jgi:Tfp pilus assembly protein PilF
MRNAQRLSLVLAVALIWALSLPLMAQTDAGSGVDKFAKMKQVRKYLKQAVDGLDIGDIDKAMVYLDSAFLLDDSNADAHYFKALALMQTGDTASASETLTAGISMAPMSSRLKLLMAQIHLAAAELEQAKALVDAVLAIKPRQGEALYLKGLVLLGQGDTTLALESFQKATEIGLAKGGK